MTGDERRISQVIVNLLSNAVKFSPAGGAVDVHASQLNGEVHVSVTDTGPGIAPEDHDRIFEAFQQTDAGIQQREGTGLGPRAFQAARRAARRAHLGRERAGQGQHVRVHAAVGGPQLMAGPQVLVVDDNEKNMKLFRDVLQAKGYRTLEATTGEEAVALTTEHRPDLVLMDIQLPDIDGVAALARLRADERSASIPVVALTSQAM